MAIAINVRADGDSASAVEQLWDQVAAFEDEPSMRTLGYRPHFEAAGGRAVGRKAACGPVADTHCTNSSAMGDRADITFVA